MFAGYHKINAVFSPPYFTGQSSETVLPEQSGDDPSTFPPVAPIPAIRKKHRMSVSGSADVTKPDGKGGAGQGVFIRPDLPSRCTWDKAGANKDKCPHTKDKP